MGIAPAYTRCETDGLVKPKLAALHLDMRMMLSYKYIRTVIRIIHTHIDMTYTRIRPSIPSSRPATYLDTYSWIEIQWAHTIQPQRTEFNKNPLRLYPISTHTTQFSRNPVVPNHPTPTHPARIPSHQNVAGAEIPHMKRCSSVSRKTSQATAWHGKATQGNAAAAPRTEGREAQAKASPRVAISPNRAGWPARANEKNARLIKLQDSAGEAGGGRERGK